MSVRVVCGAEGRSKARLYASFDVSICVHCRRPRSLLAHCHHAPAPQQRVNFGVEGRESDLQVGRKVYGEERVVVVGDLMCVLCALLVLLSAD